MNLSASPLTGLALAVRWHDRDYVIVADSVADLKEFWQLFDADPMEPKKTGTVCVLPAPLTVCPHCLSWRSRVTGSYEINGCRVRRRECEHGHRFTTRERVSEE